MTEQSLLTPAEQKRQAGHDQAIRHAYRSSEELAMRDALEGWCRARWPDARIVHELVMGRGSVRADLAVVEPDHLVAFEIKGPHDNMMRLVHQVALYRLSVPELWLVVGRDKDGDAELIRYLLPSIGVLRVTGLPHSNYRSLVEENGSTVPIRIELIHPAELFRPDPECLLQLCWSAELLAIAGRTGCWQQRGSKPPAHARLVAALKALSVQEMVPEVCAELRARQAFWRADPPIDRPRTN